MKKIISISMASMMLISMAACSGDGDTSTTENTTSAEASSEVATTVTTTETTTETSTAETTSAESGTIGASLAADFKTIAEENPDISAQEMADALLTNSSIIFQGMTMPVEAGLLTGFGEAEITGFKECVMFSPMIGTIPFVGYIFKMEEGSDIDGFVQTLADNADPRWNICTEADETIIETSGNTVFFLMCPSQLEE